MANKKSQNEWYVNLLKILKLETSTPSGRINLAGIILLVIFCLAYTARDVILYLIFATSDTIKSINLGQDINHPYQGTSLIKAVSPILIGFGLCLLFLWFNNKKQDGIKDTKKEEVEDPTEK